MSKRETSSVNNSTGKSRQSVQPYQPVWMAHWMGSSSTAAAERRNQRASGSEELERASTDESLTNGLEASRSVKEQGVIEMKTFEAVNESLRFSSESLRNEEMCSSLVKHDQDADGKQAMRPVFGHSLERGKAIDRIGRIQLPSEIPTVNETPFAGFLSLGEGTSKNHVEWMKTHSPANDRSFEMSKPFQGTFVGTSTHIVPYYDPGKYNFDKGKAAVSPLISRPSVVPNNQLLNANLRMIGQEHCHKHIQSADSICERKMDIHAELDTSLNASFRECNTSLLFDAPSTSGHRMPTSGQDWFQKTQKHPGVTLLPSQCIASEKTESKKSHHDCYSLQKLPNSVHDLKTMRICTTVDSVEAMPGGCPRFSQTTHSLLITKKTDVSLPKENDTFRTTRLITKVNGNTSSDLHSLAPFLGQGNRGVKLQPLSSSSNSEGKQNVGDVKSSKVTIKNESSAETDTMDVDFLKGNLNSGANSPPSTKGFNIDSNLSPRTDIASPREVGRRCMNTGLPDINLELPALPAVASSSENAIPSSSKTQSLEMDMLPAHVEQPKRKSNLCPDDSSETDPTSRWVKPLKLPALPAVASSSENAIPSFSKTQSLEMDMLPAHVEQPKRKSNLCLDDSSETDPTSRWVKRLKLRPSNSSAKDTKISNLAENSSHDKRRTFFRSILETCINNTEPTSRKHHGKETIPSKEDKDSTVDPAKKGKELLLSHTWIKRWLRNGSRITQKKPEMVVMCEPQSSKLDDLKKKQFPSIGAMALMGKAMSSFQSCELQKQGSLTLWNTKAF